MIDFPAAFLGAAGVTLCLVAMGIIVPVRRRNRLLVFGCAAVALGLASVGASLLFGRPQPTALALVAPEDSWFDVMYADWTEGEGIYVLLRRPDSGAPRLYVLPWRRALAEQLQGAIITARERNGVIRMANVLQVPAHELEGSVVFTAYSAAPGAFVAPDPTQAPP